MSEHACLLASRLFDPFGQAQSSHYTTHQAYRAVAGLVTRAWGRVASSCRWMAYRFGGQFWLSLYIILIAAGA